MEKRCIEYHHHKLSMYGFLKLCMGFYRFSLLVFHNCTFLFQYESIHRYDTNKLRNVAKFFGHLLYSDAIPWTVSVSFA